MTSITFNLPKNLMNFIRSKMAKEHYRSEEECIRALLEAQKQEEESLLQWELLHWKELQQKLEQGLASGKSIPATAEYWQQKKRKLQA